RDTAFANGGCEYMRAVGDRFRSRIEHAGVLDDDVRARSRRPGGRIRPAVAWGDEAEFGQAEIEHRSRRLADILAKLRADEDDDGGRQFSPASATAPANSWKSRASANSL